MPDLPGTRAAFHALHSLRRVADLGLASYVTGRAKRGRHVMRLTRPGTHTHRTLLRGEPRAWAAGLAAGAGAVELGEQIPAQPVPLLLPAHVAAERISLSVQGIYHAVRGGVLYPLYGNRADGTGQALYLFKAQVAVEQAARKLAAAAGSKPARLAELKDQLGEARQAWLPVRSLLPTPIPEAMADVDVEPLPSPDPLPLDPHLAGPVRAVRGLQVAESMGWLTYHYPIRGGYAVTMADSDGTQTDLIVPAEGLLAWLLGVADWHGRADLVAYRPGLGG